jgi:hypothetical protein
MPEVVVTIRDLHRVSPPAPSNARQVVGRPALPRFRRARARRVLGFPAPEVACERALRQRACRPSWPRAPLQSPPLAPAGEPASSRGVGVHPAVTRRIPALRPSTDTSAARPLPVTGATFGLEATSLEVPFRPRGFSPPRRFSPRDGSQVCCTLQPALGFAAFRIVKSVSQLLEPPLRRDHPPKDTTSPTAVTRSLAPVAPLAFFLDSSRCTPFGETSDRSEAVAFEALIRGRMLDESGALQRRDHRVPSWAFSPLRGPPPPCLGHRPCHQGRGPGTPAAIHQCYLVWLASCRLRRLELNTVAGESSRPP